MTTTPQATSLPARVRIGYATGSLATGAFGTVPGLLLLPYLTDTLGIAAGLAGLLVLLPKAWDVVVNPIAGRLSDRTHTRWGARRPYLLGGGFALAVTFALIFAGVFRGGAGAAWVAVTFLLTATAFAFFQVPYVAMPAEMTDGYEERTRMMTWRVALLALAILISGAVAPAVRDAAGGGIAGYRAMGIFVAGLIVLGALGAFFGTRGAPAGREERSEPSLRAQLAVVAGNRPFRVLVACFVVQATGVAAMLAGVQYFADHVLHDPDAVTYLFAGVVAPALLVMPLWRRVGERLGKLRGYVIASLMITVTTLSLGLSSVLPVAAVYALVALLGVGYAGQQLFGLSMLPDCIAYDTMRTGRRQAGVFTGVWTAGETFGLALGPQVFGLMLQLFGYRSSTTGQAAQQSDMAQLGVLLGFTVVPGVIVGLALLFLRRYDLSADQLDGADRKVLTAPAS
ncbi:MFS transporter [Luedemannella helvata]|uniref:MFS transporter n=1 Tax=Luedemannella helvata TaxID=349315 RepID=A0ABN2L3L6_9ACTN